MARPPKAPRDSTIRIPLLPKSRPWFDPATGKPTDEFATVIHDLIRRTGGQVTDAVAIAIATASVAQATAAANSAGVAVPSVGGPIQLVPVNPLSYVLTGSGLATINVAQHTRTGAASPILAGAVANAEQNNAYYVWYRDLANAGGAVTFVIAVDLSTFDASLGDRLIGSILIPYTASTSGVETEP